MPWPDLLEQDLLLGIGVGVADGGDLLPGDAVLHQLGDDVLVDGVPPGGGVDPQIGEDHLRAACGGRPLPDGGDVPHQGVDLGVGEVLGLGRSSRASSASLRPSVVMARALSSQGLTVPSGSPRSGRPGSPGSRLLLGHRAGDDRGLAAFETGAGEVQHRGRLHVGVVRNICWSSGRLVNFAKRLRGRRLVPSGEISMASTTSPNVAAQPSKWAMPRLHPLGIEVALHRIHFDHRVTDRCARGEGHAMAGVLRCRYASSCRGRRRVRCPRSGCRPPAPSWSASPGS